MKKFLTFAAGAAVLLSASNFFAKEDAAHAQEQQKLAVEDAKNNKQQLAESEKTAVSQQNTRFKVSKDAMS